MSIRSGIDVELQNVARMATAGYFIGLHIRFTSPLLTFQRLCCTNPVRDSPCESSVVAVVHEQTEAADLPHHELA